MNLFDNIVNSVLNENANVAGGAGSVLGAGVTATSSHNSGDFYAPEDSRIVKPLGKGVIRRNMPKDSIYSGKIKSKKRHKRRK